MDDLSEKEQIEEIRKWFSEYGAWVFGGVVAAIALVGGWNYYTSSQVSTQLNASDQYEALADLIADGDVVDAEAVAGEILTSYGDTVYAAQTGLAMAGLYMEQSRDEDAADSLRTVVETSADAGLQNVARVRLARVYLYQDKPNEALQLIESVEAPAFAAAFAEIRGDAHAALGNVSEAEAAYQAVLADPNAPGTVDMTIVQWKLLDLPRVAAEPEEAAAVETESDIADEATEESE